MQDQKERTLEALIQDLGEGEAENRLAAIKALGGLGDPAAIDPLRELLDSPEPRIRIRAVMALGQIADARAIEPLSRVLTGDEIPEVRSRAARALGEIAKPEAIEALGQALKDPDAEVRRRALQALNRIGDAGALEPLIQALSDSDRDVRRWAARGLGIIGQPEALEPLGRLRTDPNPLVQNEAAQAVRAIQDREQLRAHRDKVKELRQQRSLVDLADQLQQVQLEGDIDLEQLRIYQLEASLAAQEVAPPPTEEISEEDRQSRVLAYELEQLTRELEHLSNSVRASFLRDQWKAQLSEAYSVRTLWQEAGDEVSLDAKRDRLQEMRRAKDDFLQRQDEELVKMVGYIREAHSSRFQIQRIYDLVSDPANQATADSYRTQADAEYQALRKAREQGDYKEATEHYGFVVNIRNRAEDLRREEMGAKERAGKLVIRSILVCAIVLVIVIALLQLAGLGDEIVPVLRIPYSVIAWSALGSIAAMLYQFLNRPVSQLETVRWLVVRPIQGIIMGSFLYLVISAGLLALGSASGAPVRAELAPVIAFLGGFSDRFAEEMVRRATSILSQEPTEREETPPAASPGSG